MKTKRSFRLFNLVIFVVLMLSVISFICLDFLDFQAMAEEQFNEEEITIYQETKLYAKWIEN